MGVDLYLESLWKPFIEQYEPRPAIDEDLNAVMSAAERMFDDFRSSGGYFRNGYNCGECDVCHGAVMARHSAANAR